MDMRDKQGLSVLGTAEELKKRLAQQTSYVEIIHNYVKNNFIEGIDYGIADNRSDKNVLLKPGAEKICSTFGTSPKWVQDTESWSMLGEPNHIICLKCYILDNKTGAIVGEGRGAETVGSRNRDENNTIKIAEKRALVDAALNTFMLSSKFGQDGAPVDPLLKAKRDLFQDIKAKILQHQNLTDKQVSAYAKAQIVNILKTSIINSQGEINKIREVLFSKEFDWKKK